MEGELVESKTVAGVESERSSPNDCVGSCERPAQGLLIRVVMFWCRVYCLSKVQVREERWLWSKVASPALRELVYKYAPDVTYDYLLLRTATLLRLS